MKNYILKKRIEPYVLLETLKSNYEMIEFPFDGMLKMCVMNEFIESLKNDGAFGLYMKNVNKYYLFKGDKPLDIESLFLLTSEDYGVVEIYSYALHRVDIGNAEAAILMSEKFQS